MLIVLCAYFLLLSQFLYCPLADPSHHAMLAPLVSVSRRLFGPAPCGDKWASPSAPRPEEGFGVRSWSWAARTRCTCEPTWMCRRSPHPHPLPSVNPEKKSGLNHTSSRHTGGGGAGRRRVLQHGAVMLLRRADLRARAHRRRIHRGVQGAGGAACVTARQGARQGARQNVNPPPLG